MTERFANRAHSTLSGDINDVVGSLGVDSAALFPAANFRIAVEDEIMIVTAVVGTTFTVTRGAEGTTAVAHAAGTQVSHRLTAAGLTQGIIDWAPKLAGSIEIVVVSPGSGIYTDIELPFSGTFTGWSVLNDAAGSITYDIWIDTYANFPPTVADAVTASDKPKTTGSSHAQGSCSGWTTAFAAGKIMRVNIDSASGLGRSVLSLKYTRT